MIKLKSMHHVRFTVHDVDASERFCIDFGLTTARREPDRVFMRGAGSDAYSFVAERGAKTEMTALAFMVESLSELERAVRDHGASAVRTLDGPGGGRAVTLRDPNNIPFDLVWDVAPASEQELRDDLVYNTARDKRRRGARQQMPEQQPPQVLRLGHVGVFVDDVDASVRWHGEVFGIVPSDSV